MVLKISECRDQIVLLNQDAKELLQPQQLRKFYKPFINLVPSYVKKGTQLYKNIEVVIWMLPIVFR